MPLHEHLHVSATARASFYLYNTYAEVDALITALLNARRDLPAIGGIQMDMYREIILDHARTPHHPGVLNPADSDHEEHNPLCGDRLHLTMRVNEDRIITDVAWDGEGCAISQAAASMLGDEIIGKTLDEVTSITKDDIFEMVGIPLTINRVKCALLSLKTLIIARHGRNKLAKDRG